MPIEEGRTAGFWVPNAGRKILAQMALTALVIGTVMAALATGRVTIPLVLSTTVAWSWIPVIQLLTGLVLVSGRGPDRPAALARYFASGRYWSLWLLTLGASLLLFPSGWAFIDCALLTFVIPTWLTVRELVGLRRELFGDAPALAMRRVAVHQALTHAAIVLYVSWAVALPPRVLAAVGQ